MATTWEIEVEMRVRKTFRLEGPEDEELVRKIILDSLVPGGLWKSFVHHEPHYAVMRPVEEIIDNEPVIVNMTTAL